MSNSGNSDSSRLPAPNETDAESRALASDITDRLKLAVDLAGGPARVSGQSGIPLRTLGHYLAGRDVRGSSLVRLADACGVSVEWLVAGRGEMKKPAERESALSLNAHGASLDRKSPDGAVEHIVFTTNYDHLVQAVLLAEEAFSARGIQPQPAWKARVVRAVCRMLDKTEAQPGDAKSLATIMSLPWHEQMRRQNYILAGKDPDDLSEDLPGDF